MVLSCSGTYTNPKGHSLCGRSTQYACVRIINCHCLSDFVCLSLLRVPESTVNLGSGILGDGEVYSAGGGGKEGCGF